MAEHLHSKKSGKGKRPGKGGNRFWKNIGLGFKTPREAIEVMEEGRQKDLQLLEEIIDNGLKQKLVHTVASRDKIFEEQKVLSDLRKNVETLEKNGVNSLKTMVNLGSEVYMQAEVPDTRHIFMDVGLGFYVEFTRQEALDYISQREERIKKPLEEVTGVITQIKGRIKLAHYQIQQILNLPEENPSSSRHVRFSTT